MTTSQFEGGQREHEEQLDRALQKLPREIAAGDALWSRIAAEIAEPAAVSAQPREQTSELPGNVMQWRAAPAKPDMRRSMTRARWLQLAAGVLLIVASSLTTWMVTQRSMRTQMAQTIEQTRRSASQSTVQQMQPVLEAMPASFGAQEALGPGYVEARAQLLAEFERRLALLPPVTRAKVERDLADLRRAANEISVTLGQHPTDPLLQQLMLSAYQNELALLGSMNDLTAPSAVGADL
jgi:hypothetical protein